MMQHWWCSDRPQAELLAAIPNALEHREVAGSRTGHRYVSAPGCVPNAGFPPGVTAGTSGLCFQAVPPLDQSYDLPFGLSPDGILSDAFHHQASPLSTARTSTTGSQADNTVDGALFSQLLSQQASTAAEGTVTGQQRQHSNSPQTLSSAWVAAFASSQRLCGQLQHPSGIEVPASANLQQGEWALPIAPRDMYLPGLQPLANTHTVPTLDSQQAILQALQANAVQQGQQCMSSTGWLQQAARTAVAATSTGGTPNLSRYASTLLQLGVSQQQQQVGTTQLVQDCSMNTVGSVMLQQAQHMVSPQLMLQGAHQQQQAHMQPDVAAAMALAALAGCTPNVAAVRAHSMPAAATGDTTIYQEHLFRSASDNAASMHMLGQGLPIATYSGNLQPSQQQQQLAQAVLGLQSDTCQLGAKMDQLTGQLLQGNASLLAGSYPSTLGSLGPLSNAAAALNLASMMQDALGSAASGIGRCRARRSRADSRGSNNMATRDAAARLGSRSRGLSDASGTLSDRQDSQAVGTREASSCSRNSTQPPFEDYWGPEHRIASEHDINCVCSCRLRNSSFNSSIDTAGRISSSSSSSAIDCSERSESLPYSSVSSTAGSAAAHAWLCEDETHGRGTSPCSPAVDVLAERIQAVLSSSTAGADAKGKQGSNIDAIQGNDRDQIAAQPGTIGSAKANNTTFKAAAVHKDSSIAANNVHGNDVTTSGASAGSVADDQGREDKPSMCGGCPVWFPGPRETSGDDTWYLPLPPTSRLFVGNIGCWVDEAMLLAYFGQYGHVVDVQVMWNTKMLARGRRVNREFAFVSLSSPVEAARAVHWLDGCRLADLQKDRNGITVEYENGEVDTSGSIKPKR